jgi:hypothetical protein
MDRSVEIFQDSFTTSQPITWNIFKIFPYRIFYGNYIAYVFLYFLNQNRLPHPSITLFFIPKQRNVANCRVLPFILREKSFTKIRHALQFRLKSDSSTGQFTWKHTRLAACVSTVTRRVFVRRKTVTNKIKILKLCVLHFLSWYYCDCCTNSCISEKKILAIQHPSFFNLYLEVFILVFFSYIMFYVCVFSFCDDINHEKWTTKLGCFPVFSHL